MIGAENTVLVNKLEKIALHILTWAPAILVVSYTLLFFTRISLASFNSLFLAWSALLALTLYALIRETAVPKIPAVLFLGFVLVLTLSAFLTSSIQASIFGDQYETLSVAFFLFLVPFFLLGTHARKFNLRRVTQLLFYGLSISQVLFWVYALEFETVPLQALFLSALQILLLSYILDARRGIGLKFVAFNIGCVVPAFLLLLFHAETALFGVLAGTFLFVLCAGALFQGRAVTDFPTALTGSIVLGFVWAISSVAILPNALPVERESVTPWPLYTEVIQETLALEPSLLILGHGANQFSAVYERYKPTDINASDAWDITFLKGPSISSEFIFSVGALGTMFFLAFLFSCIRRGVSIGQKHIYSGAVILFIFLSALFFHPPASLFIILAFLLGAYAHGIRRAPSLRSSRVGKIIPPILIFITFLVSVHVLQTSFSAIHYERGISHLAEANIESAINSFSNAIAHKATPETLERRAFAGQLLLDRLSEIESPTEEDREVFFSVANRAVGDAEAAYKGNPSYRNAMTAGNIHTILYLVGIRTSLESADFFYSEAKNLAPRSPLPPFARGRLFVLSGEGGETGATELKHSLSIKEDFEPARALLRSIQNR